MMSKRKTNFEQVPVEVVKKIAKLQPANHERVVAKSTAPKTQPYATATAPDFKARLKEIFPEE